MGVLRQHCVLGREYFGYTDIFVTVDNLPLQVGVFHDVVINHTDGAHTRRSQILQRGRTQTASADHQHLGVFQLFLPLPADFPQHDVAGVAIQF